MPTKDELELENAELKAQLEALQPIGNVCVLCGAGIAEPRYYVRHPEFEGGPPVNACYDCFDAHTQAGHWVADMDEESEAPAAAMPLEPEDEAPEPEDEQLEPAEGEGE